MLQSKGKFIIFYGINNLGKSTQAKLLVERLNRDGQAAEYIKYPIYDLEPSGPMLNNYLRKNNPYNLAPREAQTLYTINRTQYEKEIVKKLNQGIHIVSEDYKGTGISWGMGAGVSESYLKKINSHLLEEDIVFLFDGERFMEATEENHKHETNDELLHKVRLAHLKLAEEENWIKINANDTIDNIHNNIWQYIVSVINPNFIQKQNYLIQKLPQTLEVERLSSTAKLPSRAYKHDAGYDIYSNDYYSLLPGDIVNVKTGLKITVPKGHVGLIRDKSGVANDGVHCMAGIIDPGYCGEWLVNMINLGQDIYNISPGQKVAQILIQKVEHPTIVETKIKEETDRGDGGFGSSGLF